MIVSFLYMKLYLDTEGRKQLIRDYLRRYPRATSRELKKNLRTKVERVYARGLDEAYEDAHVPKPRTLKFKTLEERRKLVIEYIRRNPKAGGHVIRRDTKVNFLAVFKNTKEAYLAAGVKYEREHHRLLMKRPRSAKRQKIIKLLKQNPLISVDKIRKLVNAHPHSLFKNTKEMYHAAGIPFLSKGDKRRINKQKIVFEYIRNNPFATQREVNRFCRTKVQNLFLRGIFEAYEGAKIPFPFERLSSHGAAIPEIRNAAIKFEEDIARKLLGYGCVNRLVRTKSGRADIIFERKGRKVAIELKNYKVHEISFSQVKQLNKYLQDINSNLGFLICLKRPKKDTFLIGENKIFVLEESELNRLPELMDL